MIRRLFALRSPFRTPFFPALFSLLAEFVGLRTSLPCTVIPFDLDREWPHGLAGTPSRESVTCPVYQRAPAKFRKFLKSGSRMHSLPKDWRGELPLGPAVELPHVLAVLEQPRPAVPLQPDPPLRAQDSWQVR